ncbi:MAG: hypothetical protein K5746_07635 [Clostridiales bacterium]|nr:hypothetical protein [Clostridiales bacterium]
MDNFFLIGMISEKILIFKGFLDVCGLGGNASFPQDSAGNGKVIHNMLCLSGTRSTKKTRFRLFSCTFSEK